MLKPTDTLPAELSTPSPVIATGLDRATDGAKTLNARRQQIAMKILFLGILFVLRKQKIAVCCNFS